MYGEARDKYGFTEADKEARLRALIRHIVAREPGISEAKLCCLLCLCDMEHYRRTGKPMTGVEYIKLDDDSPEWQAALKRKLYPGPKMDEPENTVPAER